MRLNGAFRNLSLYLVQLCGLDIVPDGPSQLVATYAAEAADGQ